STRRQRCARISTSSRSRPLTLIRRRSPNLSPTNMPSGHRSPRRPGSRCNRFARRENIHAFDLPYRDRHAMRARSASRASVRAGLPHPTDPHRGAVPGRWPDRHPVADRRTEDERGLRPAGRGREPAGRRHRAGRRASRQGSARWLHAARRHGHHAGDESGDKTSLPYDPFKDFAAISLGAKNTSLLTVRAEDGPKSIAELIALGKAKNGTMNYGAGIITTRLAGYLFNREAGIKAQLIPYKGSAEVVQGLLTGAVDYIVDGTASSLPLISSG